MVRRKLRKPSVKAILMTKKIVTGDIIEYLNLLHKPRSNPPEVVTFEEVRMGLGYEGNDAVQRIDYWVFYCWKTDQYKRISYEIKASRADFLNEVKKPTKKRMAMLVSNYYYFIAPKGIIKPEEVPLDCGLIELTWAHNRSNIEYITKLREDSEKSNLPPARLPAVPKYKEFLVADTTVEAPWRDSLPPSWKFLGSLCRRVVKKEKEKE